MDWGRIKTIFIIIFLVVDLALSGLYFYNLNEDAKYAAKARDNAVAYAAEEGIKLSCELPVDQPEMETLSVTLTKGGGVESYGEKTSYQIIATGKDGLGVIVDSTSENKRKTDSASRALIKLLQSFSKEEREGGLEVSAIDLVYWVELSEGSDEGQKNTAIPSWRFVMTDGREFIFRAYSE